MPTRMKSASAPGISARSERALRLVGHSMPMEALRKAINKVVKVASVAEMMIPILITGETGSGKELVARLIHEKSNRSDGPFLAVNCAALPEGLFQAELFGVEKGAFTSAYRNNVGRVEAADGGTLLLDEIGDLTLEMQLVLLRFLDEGAYEHLGSVRSVKADVRVIAATHIDLEKACSKGAFREDLFHRLNALRVRVPPLRELGDDVIEIAEYFIDQLSGQLRLCQHSLTPEAVKCLLAHSWPGNVRELRNRVLQALTTAEGPELSAELLGLVKTRNAGGASTAGEKHRTLIECRKAAERRAIERALIQTDNNVTAAAEYLGISRAQLYRLINNHAIELPRD